MKRMIYKGIPLASVHIAVVVPKPFRLSVSADPSWGVKIFLEEESGEPGMGDQGLTGEQAAELARRLVQAGTILDDIKIKDDAVPDLQLRADRLRNKNEVAWAGLQDALDSTVHDLANQVASSLNNMGADKQIEHLVLELGKDEVERMIAVAEEGQEIVECRHGEPMCSDPRMVGNRCVTCGLVSSLPQKDDKE